MIAVAYVEAPLDVAMVEKTLGAKVGDLAAAHEKVLAATAARADARDAGAKFRETTPIRLLPICPR